MKMMYSAAALVAALGLATTSLAQSTGKAGPRPRQAKHKMTLVPTGAPQPSEQPEYFPVGQHGPVSGESLRSPSIVYQNTGGGYYIATDPAPGGNPPLNGLMEGVAFTTANTWANGSPLTQIQTVVRKHVSTVESFLVVVRIFNTIDATLAPPALIDQAQIGATVAFGPITNAGGVGNYLTTLNTTGAWAGALFTDNTIGIDIKLVLATATPADYVNPAFLHDKVNVNFFTTQGLNVAGQANPPTTGSEYPTPDTNLAAPNYGCWADDADAVVVIPPVLRDGDYQQDEAIFFSATAHTANLYLKVTADVACLPAAIPLNDACAAAAVITPPPSGGSVFVPDGSASPPVAGRSGTTTCAGVDADPGAVYCAGLPTTPSGVWYKYTGQGRRVSVHTCAGTHPAYDSIVSVFTGTCGGGLVCVDANNDVKQINTYASQFSCGPTSSRVDFDAAAATDYLIFVRAVNNVGGDFDLTLVDSGFAVAGACALTAPAGATIEADGLACGGDINGTCAGATTLAACQTVYGTIDAAANTVDADIYLYNIPTGESGYILHFQSEFPAFVNVLREADITNPCNFITVNAGGQFAIPACTQYDITFSGMVAADRHEIVVTTPRGNSPATCGTAGSHYILRVEPQAGCITGPNCFTHGPNVGDGVCSIPTGTNQTHTRPQANGHYAMGGADAAADALQCMGDWDGDGCVTPADVAAYIVAWFFSANNPGNLDGDIDCSLVADPADVAIFVQRWFAGLNTPPTEGCI